VTGCGQGESPKDKPAVSVPVQASTAKETTADNGAQQPAATQPPGDPRLEQPFADATLADPPPGCDRPPDMTMTHKSVGKLYTDVVAQWNNVHFTAPSGKRIAYKAIVETKMGSITMTLRPDIAPNHVRNFVALARAGYYDGLVFERTVHEDIEGKPEMKVEIIEAGCPLGTGEVGQGSIGYWLKPEINAQVLHEEGTVGACHGEDADTAACKFYINLSKAPFMDGSYTVFGKVTDGLNVARKILTLPVSNDPQFPEGDRPLDPVVIDKVTIVTEEVDEPSPN
jgi:cyclophilin family peptidyl-prolyl cis-trans isomerase